MNACSTYCPMQFLIRGFSGARCVAFCSAAPTRKRYRFCSSTPKLTGTVHQIRVQEILTKNLKVLYTSTGSLVRCETRKSFFSYGKGLDYNHFEKKMQI